MKAKNPPRRQHRCDAPHAVVQITRDKLVAMHKDTPVYEIAHAAGCPPDWLYLFMRGQLRKPGAHRVLNLYEWLTGERIV